MIASVKTKEPGERNLVREIGKIFTLPYEKRTRPEIKTKFEELVKAYKKFDPKIANHCKQAFNDREYYFNPNQI
ncbi:hypothetical protein K9L16_00905 [Candidatus Pacearchaeota archaeon]|nr:hypothetical protein [Candidatus Pacearchaeota archaeon]